MPVRSQRGAVIDTTRARTLVSDFKSSSWAADAVLNGAVESVPTTVSHGTSTANAEHLLISMTPNGSVTAWGGRLYYFDGVVWKVIDDQSSLGTSNYEMEYVARGWDRYMWAILTVTGGSGSVARRVKLA